MGNINYERILPHHYINLNCTGDEETIWNCSNDRQEQQYCSTYYDASVACHGKNFNSFLGASLDFIRL